MFRIASRTALWIAILALALLLPIAAPAQAAGGSMSSWWTHGGGWNRGGIWHGGNWNRGTGSGTGWNKGNWKAGSGKPGNWKPQNWKWANWTGGNGGWNKGWRWGGWHGGWWNGGGWNHGWRGGWWGWGNCWCCNVGWGSSVAFTFGAPFGYPYSPYADASYVDSPAPSEPIAQQAPQASWYHCDDPNGFYPYVKSCKGAWTAVPVTPPDATH
jgi:hypothetical protein